MKHPRIKIKGFLATVVVFSVVGLVIANTVTKQLDVELRSNIRIC